MGSVAIIAGEKYRDKKSAKRVKITSHNSSFVYALELKNGRVSNERVRIAPAAFRKRFVPA